MFIRISVLSILALVGSMTAAQAAPAQEPDRLQQMASNARSAQDHIAVSQAYRQRAADLDAQARTHEQAVVNADRRRTPPERKWPGTLLDRAGRERQQALEVRRAADEARRAADQHLRLSVEALARADGGGSSTATN